MARLTMSRLPLVPASRRIAAVDPEKDFEKRRAAALEWRKWYKTKDWQRLRWRVLVRDLFTCRMCGRIEAETRRLVADHVVPHRGDAGMFWDDGNLQCLCQPCHDGTKQKAERRR